MTQTVRNHPRYKVIYGVSADELQAALNGADEHDDYDVVGMSSAPWFENNQNDNSLCQTADSIYVILRRKS